MLHRALERACTCSSGALLQREPPLRARHFCWHSCTIFATMLQTRQTELVWPAPGALQLYCRRNPRNQVCKAGTAVLAPSGNAGGWTQLTWPCRVMLCRLGQPALGCNRCSSSLQGLHGCWCWWYQVQRRAVLLPRPVPAGWPPLAGSALTAMWCGSSGLVLLTLYQSSICRLHGVCHLLHQCCLMCTYSMTGLLSC